MSVAPQHVTPPRRHALGLPAGSIRAVLALAVLGLLWLVVLFPLPGQAEALGHRKMDLVFVYLQMLMVLILAHFFTAHGGSIQSHPEAASPLGLPRGSVRFLLLAGYLGLTYYLWHNHLSFDYPPQAEFLLLLALLLSAFFLGHIITGLVLRMSGGTLPYGFQDFQAWIALLALLGLGAILVVQLFINPTLAEPQRLTMQWVEEGLAALVGFYFGARS
jgi:hypothetical protein